MHRSATSMVARSLHKSGEVFMGKTLIRHKDNPEGHYEDADFLKINKDILSMFGGSWKNPPEIDIDVAVNEFRARIEECIKNSEREARLQGYRSWGFKDPRTCITFPVYARIIDDIQIITTNRDPLEVAKSLNKWHRVPISDGIKLNDYYNGLIAKHISEYR